MLLLIMKSALSFCYYIPLVASLPNKLLPSGSLTWFLSQNSTKNVRRIMLDAAVIVVVNIIVALLIRFADSKQQFLTVSHTELLNCCCSLIPVSKC